MAIDFGAAMNGHPAMAGTLYDAIAAPAPAPAVNPLDLTPVREALGPYRTRLDDMVAQADALFVESDDQQRQAVEMAGQAKKLGKALDEARKRFVAAPGDYVRSVNALAKELADRLVLIETGLKRKISTHQARVELERRKAEEAARKAAAELQAKVDAEAKAAGVETVQVAAPVIPEAPKVVRTEAGAAHQRKEWVFRVTDPAAIPRDYLVVDERAIREAVKAGVREIPGVEIFEETKTVIRT